MDVGDPPECQDVPTCGLIHIEPSTPVQTVNHGDEDLVLYAYGTPPEHENAEILEPPPIATDVSGRSRPMESPPRQAGTSTFRHRRALSDPDPVHNDMRDDRACTAWLAPRS
jgi:hypothetical protein